METRRVIRQIIKEVTGISFEVRKWANIIEKEVDEKKPKPKYASYYGGYGGYGGWDDYDYGYGGGHSQTQDTQTEKEEDSYSHFESIYSTGVASVVYINSEDLMTYISGETMKGYESESPGLLDILDEQIIFKVEIVRGVLISDVHTNDSGIKVDDFYMTAVDDLLYEFLAVGGYFYDLNGEFYMPIANGNMLPATTSTTEPKKVEEDVKIITVKGEDHPDAYKDFKVDKWVIGQQSDDIRVEYEHRLSGYNEEGEYVVYLNMPFSSVNGSVLVHEIKHAYDDWNRMSSGHKPIRDGWEIKNIYTPDFEKLVLGGLNKYPLLIGIVKLYYLGSKLEAPAYLENTYDGSQIVNYKDVAKKLMDFSVDNYTNKKGKPAKGLQDQWTNIIIDHNIPLFRKYPDVMKFLRYTEKYFNKRGNDIFKRIHKMMYVQDRQFPKFVHKSYKR
jgi:hypothetical protein